MLRPILVVLASVLGVLALVVVASLALDRPATTVDEEMVIHAPRRVVWRLLTDFDAYETWNPYVTAASGAARKDERIHLRLEARGQEPLEVDCDVQDVTERRKVRWRCRTYVPGLLDREHGFWVLPLRPGSVRLVYHGRWEGLLVPFVDLDDRKSGYRRMAQALKELAERSTSG
jgi:hypothetical protein